MTCKTAVALSRTSAMRPVLGVTPPSSRSLHNSMRPAPPRSAAQAEATESTQTSMRILPIDSRTIAWQPRIRAHAKEAKRSSRSFHKMQPMRHKGLEDVSVQQNDDPHDRPKRHRMPRHEAENNAFIANLLGSCGRNRNGLSVDHFPHHSAGAVGGAHQNWIDSKLLRRNALQASEERVRRSVASREGNTQPAQKRPEKRIEPSRARKCQTQHGVQPRVARHVAQPQHE